MITVFVCTGRLPHRSSMTLKYIFSLFSSPPVPYLNSDTSVSHFSSGLSDLNSPKQQTEVLLQERQRWQTGADDSRGRDYGRIKGNISDEVSRIYE